VRRREFIALPAANGMKARIGLDGQGCASAAPEPRPIAAAMIAGYQQDFMSCVLRHATVQLECVLPIMRASANNQHRTEPFLAGGAILGES
jgi:hypothetical protein